MATIVTVGAGTSGSGAERKARRSPVTGGTTFIVGGRSGFLDGVHYLAHNLAVGDRDRRLHGETSFQQFVVGGEHVGFPAVHVEPTDALSGELEVRRP